MPDVCPQSPGQIRPGHLPRAGAAHLLVGKGPHRHRHLRALDPKSQDISELVGSIDLATVGEFGAESDPRAYRFDGELNIANRGMIEFIEMLKADERFLYILLTLTQEKNIKTGRFSLIYADEFVIAHTNEAEFKEFLADKKSEALQDRMIMVQMPYNLKASAEVKSMRNS